MKPRQPDAAIPALSGVNSRPVSGNMRFEVPQLLRISLTSFPPGEEISYLWLVWQLLESE